MKTTGHGIEDSKDVENMYHMRLMTLLQELVRERGYRGAARALEIGVVPSFSPLRFKGRCAGAGDRPAHGGRERKDGKAVAAYAGGPGAGFAVGRGFYGGPPAGAQRRLGGTVGGARE